MRPFYLPIAKTRKTLFMAPTSLCHPLTLSMAKKNMKSRRSYATAELQLTPHSWSNRKDIQLKKTPGLQNRIWKMQSLLLPHTKDSIPLFSLFNSLSPTITTTMSTNASLISTVSSLPLVSLLSSCSPSPSSTKSNTGWGISWNKSRRSPDGCYLPTPPTHSQEPSVAQPITPSPILSVDVPIHAHCLREGTFNSHQRDILHSLLYSPISVTSLSLI